MSGENLAALGPALSQMFADPLYHQWNRTTQFLSILNAAASIGDGAGKNVSFDVQFSGATASTVAEGSDVAASEFAQDPNVPAILPWATYRSSFQMSELEVAAAASSDATPTRLRQIFGERIMGSAATIARAIEQDMLTGTGIDANGNPTIVGIFNALTLSGSYAGINTATYPEWKSNILANGGTARSLSSDLMEQLDANIFVASSIPWRFIMTTANVTRKYAGLFGPSATAPLIRMNDNPTNPEYGYGNRNDGAMQPQNLTFKGQPVYRNAVSPVGKMLFGNPEFIKVKYLQNASVPQDSMYARMLPVEGSNGAGLIQATGIPMRIVSLAKTGDSYKFSMKVSLQACVVRPSAFGIISDISET